MLLIADKHEVDFLSPTLTVLTGLLVLSPISYANAKRSLAIEELTNISQAYQVRLAVLSSTAFNAVAWS